MFPAKEFERRFREILDEMDDACAQADDEAADALEELNAEFEDAIFMLHEIDPNGGDAAEELAGAVEEFDALCADYRALAVKCPPLGGLAERLGMLVRLLEGSADNM